MSKYSISFRCYFPGDKNYTDHRASIPVEEIPKWIEAYQYTHPNCKGVTVRVFFEREVQNREDGE